MKKRPGKRAIYDQFEEKRVMDLEVKERPRCRVKINKILAEGKISLEGLADGYMPVGKAKMVVIRSRGIMLQARKMLKEKYNARRK